MSFEVKSRHASDCRVNRLPNEMNKIKDKTSIYIVRVHENSCYDSVRSIWMTVFSGFGGKSGLKGTPAWKLYCHYLMKPYACVWNVISTIEHE